MKRVGNLASSIIDSKPKTKVEEKKIKIYIYNKKETGNSWPTEGHVIMESEGYIYVYIRIYTYIYIYI